MLQALPISSEIIEYIVAQEPHKDGGLHIHAFLKYEKKVAFGGRRWDIGGFHGNYLPAKSWDAVRQYVTKGSNFISNIDTDAAARKKACGRELNKRLLTEDLADLVDEGVLPLKQLISVMANREVYRTLRSPTLPRAEGFIPNCLGVTLLLDVHPKQRHYWIWSTAPNKGKTTFLKELTAAHPCYWYAYLETFQDPHPDTQFVILDEYSTASITATQLNQMADCTHKYPFKGGPSRQLHRATLIVCGNRSIVQVYPNVHELIKARFVEIEL